MGVPGFFMWLWKNYKGTNFVFSKSELEKEDPLYLEVNKLDYLLVDANCLIHPVCFKVLADNPDIKNIAKLEGKMRVAVIEYLEKIIDHVKPKKGLYIAIDGVAPVAKIKQQRSRRFKSVQDRKLYDSIRRKHEKEIPFFWTNSAITPGTQFMKRLHNHIDNWAQDYSKQKKLDILYSSCYTPCEGEHKLLQFIRNNQKENKDYKYLMYGLDADLIFLILSTGLTDAFLLREANQFDKKKGHGFNYVSINIMRQAIVERILDTIKSEIDCSEEEVDIKFVDSLNSTNLINDFIFLCYLMGNDFLPHLPSLDIYEGAVDYLIEKYVNLIIENMGTSYLIDSESSEKINQVFFNQILQELAADEEQLLIENYGKKPRKYGCRSNDPYDREIHRIENLQFKIDDPVMLGSDSMEEWEKRYFNHYFHVTPDEIAEYSREMTKHYLTGLKWVTEYYFDKCPSWNWYFPYDHPPFMNQVFKHKINFNEISFDLGTPLKPFEQLLCVLPKESAFLLPQKLQKIMVNLNSSVAHLYPGKYELDFLNKKKYWMAIPTLPSLEIDSIKRIYQKYEKKLNYEERSMSETKDIFLYHV